MKNLILALALLLGPTAANAQGVVSSADPRASAAGQQVLRDGGSAADAAMAMMLALTVVEPQSSGIGGGGFLIHHDGKTGLLDTIDGREKAPMAATPQRFLGPDGKPVPFFQAVPGGLSVGVPGNIRLMAMTHAKWGKLPWKALFAPAIKLAEDGYQVTQPMANGIGFVSQFWGKFPDTAKQYLDADGKPLAVGATVKNPRLAKVLRKLAAEGPDAFYTGDNAREIVRVTTGAAQNAGDMTLADLTAYQAKERPAVCGTYRTYRICGMGPPSSGATTVLQILGMVERFDLKKLGKDSPVAWHVIGEAMLLAYADREKYLGDRDFVDVPVAGLIDPAYIRSRSRLISANKSLGKYEAGMPPGARPRTAAVQNEVPSTTHFVAIDRNGDIVTMTSTVEGSFGSQLLANGYVLNNELTDFTMAPEKDGMPVANRVEPGKRPLSSMAPTIVYDASGKPVFTVGAAGGKTIIMQVAKALIAHLDWNESARDAIGEGLIYFNGDTIVLERGTGREALKPALEKLGHKVDIAKLGLKANAAELTSSGWVGAADPRSVGVALAE
ncbi:gamma-glutamyltransferase [Sphingomonas sp. So64.6b]|uniref:gamma-glutamyltransferase n=1 Tax=Sphingomonas sp. So64.6b TaxID=2997354 RepID=UPI0015FEB9DC|nr:gamma-glutamyltransferase [Sphingomonas sp. So64.6b]QNA84518.1 gamma-glutamyltransferase [Sphingomonas sp. So64.6b]